MYSFIFLREHTRNTSKLLSTLNFVRSMGGGPRTFPGGLNKWQWKRLHEKKAKEKEKRLLDQEKQLYQARIRSQIRAKLVGQPDNGAQADRNYTPMTADDHVKALADRFMKDGAEDLWNEADGPIESRPPLSPPTPQNSSIRSPIDLRKLIEGDRHVNSKNLIESQKRRHYSVSTRYRSKSRFNFRRNDSSTSDSDSDSDSDSGSVTQTGVGEANYLRFGARGDESSVDDEEEEKMKNRGNVRKMMSSAALGKYDMKKTRRVPLKFLEQEENLSEQVEAIRNEFHKRNLMKNAVDRSNEESILSEKRYLNL